MTEKTSRNEPARTGVVGPAGSRWTFGDFIEERREALGLSVAALAERAQISRQNYYLLKKGEQRPKLETAILLLRALELEPSVPVSGDSDLVFDVDGQPYELRIKWTSAERETSKARLMTTGAGLAALFGASAVARVPLAAGASTMPLGPALAALYLFHKYRTEQPKAKREASKYELLAEFMREAEEAKPEHLEAMLYALRKVRDEESAE